MCHQLCGEEDGENYSHRQALRRTTPSLKSKIICLLYWLLIIPYLFQVIYSSYWNLEKNWFTQIETEACSICIYASHEWMERKLYEWQTKLSRQFACRSCDFVSLQITSRYQRSCQNSFSTTNVIYRADTQSYWDKKETDSYDWGSDVFRSLCSWICLDYWCILTSST